MRCGSHSRSPHLSSCTLRRGTNLTGLLRGAPGEAQHTGTLSALQQLYCTIVAIAVGAVTRRPDNSIEMQPLTPVCFEMLPYPTPNKDFLLWQTSKNKVKLNINWNKKFKASLTYQIAKWEATNIHLIANVITISVLLTNPPSLHFLDILKTGFKAYQHSSGKRHLNAGRAMPLYCGGSQILVLVQNSTDVSVVGENKVGVSALVRNKWQGRKSVWVHDILSHILSQCLTVREIKVQKIHRF